MSSSSQGPLAITTAAEVRELVEERGLSAVKLALVDLDGIHRGKYVSKQKLFSALDGGFGFCDVVLGWDSNDQLYDNVQFTGWHTGYPDAEARVLPETGRNLPLEDDGLLFLCEFAGEAESYCPRGVLRKVLARAASMGLTVKSGFEYEFFLFEETPQSAAEKGYRNLKSFTPGNFGYSLLRSSTYAELYRDYIDLSEAMRFPIEGLHTETGPGVLEAALMATDGVEAADRAALFKTFAKVVAQRAGMMATFMAKWSNDWPGQSGHIHISLIDEDGKNVFYDDKGERGVSVMQRHFVGGQQKLMPELLALIAPTVNAYTRMVPGFWAPTHATWGVENRTCALRVIPGSAKSQRTEFRIAAADANPYLALAAAVGAGLYGIEHKIEPTAPISGNAYEASQDDAIALPNTLWDAAQRLKTSEAAKEILGENFPAHYAASREWEEREFRKHVTDWELRRYFEII